LVDFVDVDLVDLAFDDFEAEEEVEVERFDEVVWVVFCVFFCAAADVAGTEPTSNAKVKIKNPISCFIVG
jgi:hypothetical protein